jgi:hypothetical protein
LATITGGGNLTSLVSAQAHPQQPARNSATAGAVKKSLDFMASPP